MSSMDRNTMAAIQHVRKVRESSFRGSLELSNREFKDWHNPELFNEIATVLEGRTTEEIAHWIVEMIEQMMMGWADDNVDAAEKAFKKQFGEEFLIYCAKLQGWQEVVPDYVIDIPSLQDDDAEYGE